MKKVFKNRTIAVIGIALYLLSVLTSATVVSGSGEESFIFPTFFVTVSEILSLAFVFVAAIRLWKESKKISVLFISITIVLSVLTTIVDWGVGGKTIILFLNLVKVSYVLVYIWVIILLFKNKKTSEQMPPAPVNN